MPRYGFGLRDVLDPGPVPRTARHRSGWTPRRERDAMVERLVAAGRVHPAVVSLLEELLASRDEASRALQRAAAAEASIEGALAKGEAARARAEADARHAEEVTAELQQRLETVLMEREALAEELEALAARPGTELDAEATDPEHVPVSAPAADSLAIATDEEVLDPSEEQTLLRALLPVWDNLERSLEHGEAPLSAIREGVSLTQEQLRLAFSEAGLEVIEAKPGDRFDPAMHDAVLADRSSSFSKGRITSVLAAGFRRNGQLFSPTKVAVSVAQEPSVDVPDYQKAS
ncbi:MAG: nucleotide exchange factor GrpE [Myxococcota bacterium]